MMNFADRNKLPFIIRRLRKEHKMTQKQLAEHLNVTAGTVSKWEVGENLPLDHLEGLANLFGVTIDALYGREPIHPLSEPSPYKLVETFELPNTEYVYAELIQNNLSQTYEIWLFDHQFGGVKMMVYCTPIEDSSIKLTKKVFLNNAKHFLSIFRDVLTESEITDISANERSFIEGYENFLEQMDDLHRRLGID